MTTRLEKAIKDVRENLDRLSRIETDLIRTRGGLDGLPGATAVDVAIEGVGHVRDAVDQAEHELEIEAGLYLAEPELAEPAVPVCRWCGEVQGQPHNWNCPKPGPGR